MRSFLVISLAFLILVGCKKNNVIEPIIYNWPIGFTGFNKSLIDPQNLKRFTVGALLVIPNDSVSALVVQRNGTSANPILLNTKDKLTVSNEILLLLTQGNKNLKDIQETDKISGWKILSVYAFRTGKANDVTDVTNYLNDSIAKSLSGVLTYYPDGFYTFHSIDTARNTLGWYKVAMEKDVPKAILYNTLAVGPDFNSEPSLKVKTQGYGIWGIDKDAYFPLIQLNSNTFVILKAVPVNY